MSRWQRGWRLRWAGVAFAGALLALAGSCSKQSPPQKPYIHTTKAFDEIFGKLPDLPIPGPCHATVVYFPSNMSPGTFRPLPVFIVEQGKEEKLAVRTVIRGIEAGEGPADAVLKEIVHPFPPGSTLLSIDHEAGVAGIRAGGTFRAALLGAEEGERAAEALALTVAQFGTSRSVELTDEAGKTRFRATAEEAKTADPGPPILLGLMAIREQDGEAPSVLSVLFDRPVFPEEIAFYPPGSETPYPGKVFSTGFGMSAELHPEPAVSFDGKKRYRVRYSVRDGKDRRSSGDAEWSPRVVTRH
ncbi:MAG: hypothetical protein Kow00128_06770 [Deltaproteobacteria bacterium]